MDSDESIPPKGCKVEELRESWRYAAEGSNESMR